MSTGIDKGQMPISIVVALRRSHSSERKRKRTRKKANENSKGRTPNRTPCSYNTLERKVNGHERSDAGSNIAQSNATDRYAMQMPV